MADGENVTTPRMDRSKPLPTTTPSRLRLIDELWLLAIIIYVLIGTSLVPFHGDENIIIYESHDYATVFIQHQPQSLAVNPPYHYDTLEISRILDATLPRYIIGLAWDVAGLSQADLPARMWFWELDYDANFNMGNVPTDRLLTAARIPSALFLSLSIVIMFVLSWCFGGRLVAYLATGLYALNPLILLNGRRAMQEGMLLFSGLLIILLAAHISQKKSLGEQNLRGWWIALTLAGVLVLGSKNSGILYLVSAFGWIFALEIFRRDWRGALHTGINLVISGLTAVALLVALSPGLWADPLARLLDMVSERQKAMQMQVDVNVDAPTSLSERVTGIITQPFLTPVRYYEVFFWADFSPITDQITRYEASHLDGVHFGALLGIPLTLLACLGIAATLWPGLRPFPSSQPAAGLLVWLAVIIAAALANPLPWQRYYLPLVPLASLLAGIGFVCLVQLIRRNMPHRTGTAP